MAVLDSLPGVEVAITGDVADLEEYGDPDSEVEPRVITRYIEAISDANFSITCRVNPELRFQGSDVLFRIQVDGEWVESPMIRSIKKKPWVEECRGVKSRTEHDMVKKFKFSVLDIVSEHGKGGNNIAKGLGDIEIKVWHVNRLNLHVRPAESAMTNGPRTVGEKILKGKAISHSISLGDAESNRSRTLWQIDYIGSRPAATFVFKYRSRAALQSMLIIPRTPSPVPLEERPEQDLTLEEAQELVRRLRTRQASRIPTKREIKDEHEDGNPRPRKVSRPNPGTAFLKLDDDGSFRETTSSTPDFQPKKEVIELD